MANQYPKILAELASTYWAITPESLTGIVSAVRGELTFDDYSTFHGVSAEDHQSALSALGDLLPDAKYARVSGSVGSLEINGPLVPRAGALMESSGIMSIERLTREFEALEKQPGVETIMLIIDSPGGAVTGISEFAARVSASEKSTIAYVFGNAASAAYWIASAADSVISADTGLVGSIGTVITINTDSKAGAEVIRNSRSPRKQPDVATEAGRADVVAVLDQLADVFMETVATNRGVSISTVQEDFGQGALFGAVNARAVGMIDGIMPLYTLLGSLHLASHYSHNAPRAVETMRVEARNNLTEEKIKMTFEEMRNTYSAEINVLIEEARQAGARAESEKYVDLITLIKPVLSSGSYPESVKALAFKVLAGEMNADILRGAIIAIDAINAKEEAAAAVLDTESIGATPAVRIDQIAPSNDGVLRSASDVDADVNKLREFI